ncbi:hypothetical protein CU098_009472 [Rhizopus stolonifer]|uniref:Uncharacterized protein n=1 Tax=Rhizopus stolonifer TaxID=4846 RepID=A0A367JKK7_RHIST|nr:hypothetical protein CU098_009472 [Rhizopus stolonifer]
MTNDNAVEHPVTDKSPLYGAQSNKYQYEKDGEKTLALEQDQSESRQPTLRRKERFILTDLQKNGFFSAPSDSLSTQQTTAITKDMTSQIEDCVKDIPSDKTQKKPKTGIFKKLKNIFIVFSPSSKR